MKSETYDVAVVGGGAAGLSAALVLGRARRRVTVVDAGTPRNAAAPHMHGFLSREGMSPADLLSVGRDEVTRYGVELVDDQVVTAEAGFTVRLASGGLLKARRLLVTTGLRDELPDIPSLSERWAQDVLHCPYCHGYEVRDKALGVLGWTPQAASYAQIVRQWSDDVVYFAPTGTLTTATHQQLAARGIVVVQGAVRRVAARADVVVAEPFHELLLAALVRLAQRSGVFWDAPADPRRAVRAMLVVREQRLAHDDAVVLMAAVVAASARAQLRRGRLSGAARSLLSARKVVNGRAAGPRQMWRTNAGAYIALFDAALVMLGVDHEDARLADDEVVDVRPGAGDAAVVEDDDPLLAQLVEGLPDRLLTASSSRPRGRRVRVRGQGEQQPAEVPVLRADVRLPPLVASLPFARGRGARSSPVDLDGRRRGRCLGLCEARFARCRLRPSVPAG